MVILGGELVALVAAVDEEGCYPGNCKGIKQNMMTVLTSLWREMVQENTITQVGFWKSNIYGVRCHIDI